MVFSAQFVKKPNTSVFALLAPVCILLSPALAQSSDSESVDALRAEVEELRALVDALTRSQGIRVVADDQQRSANDDDSVISVPQGGTSSRDGNKPTNRRASANGILSARQQIGRFPDDAIVTAGEFDRSVRVPGTNGAFRLGGAVQINANYDTDSQGFQQIGTQPTIPLDGATDDGDEQFSIHSRHSRINFDFRAPTQYGQLRTFIEFDFFGDGDEFTNDYDLRLRHAAAELGPWKFGQFWSGFVDVFNIPETADPGGPMAQPVLRNPGIHYVRGKYDGSNWGIGIENPAADLGGNTDLIASESVPSVIAFAKLQRDWGYIRVAGMSVELKSDLDSVITGGAHLSGRFNSPLPGSDRNNFSFGAQAGEGFVHYFSSFVGELDGVVLDDGDVEATGIIGAFGA
ncbi:MAG: DcaP family trimeric outer membrane transporter, partial [Pseudomonadota bacterium]